MDLSAKERDLLKKIFVKTKNLECVILFGSRALGTATERSDIDLAVFGLKDELEIEALAMELDELPLPYKFDLTAFENIRNSSLRSHIEKVGLPLFNDSPNT